MNRRFGEDDDVVGIPREDLINIRNALAEIEDAGGLEKLKSAIRLMDKPGMLDALEEIGANHEANKWRAKFQADRAKLNARKWQFIAWLSGGVVALGAFIASIDGIVKTVRGWFP
jgi:hypothetical protein